MIKLKGLGRLDAAKIQVTMVTALSFSHLHAVAGLVGVEGWAGWIYPPSVDLLIYVGYRRIEQAKAAHASLKGGVFAIMLSAVASLAANVIALLPHGMQAHLAANLAMRIVVGAWPPVAAVVSGLLGHAHPSPVPVAALAEPEVQEEHGGEHVALHLVDDDTPEPVEQESDDTPWDELPEQGAPGFYPAVVALVSADQPVDTFPNGSAFCQAVIDALVRHGYRPVHSMTIRRAMNSKPKKAA